MAGIVGHDMFPKVILSTASSRQSEAGCEPRTRPAPAVLIEESTGPQDRHHRGRFCDAALKAGH